MPTCAFCKRARTTRQLSQEHVIPKWLSQAGAGAGDYTLQRGDKTITTPLIEIITRQVCIDCNTGWMSRLEAQAKSVIVPLLDATATQISEIDQWVIARWFTKTILTAQLALTARSDVGLLHPQDYATFHGSEQPFWNQLTMLWAYQGPLLPVRLEAHAPDETTNRGVRAFFQFHCVVLTAAFLDPQNPSNVHLPQGFGQAPNVLWPRQLTVQGSRSPEASAPWPTPMLLDEDAVLALRNAFLGSPGVSPVASHKP